MRNVFWFKLSRFVIVQVETWGQEEHPLAGQLYCLRLAIWLDAERELAEHSSCYLERRRIYLSWPQLGGCSYGSRTDRLGGGRAITAGGHGTRERAG